MIKQNLKRFNLNDKNLFENQIVELIKEHQQSLGKKEKNVGMSGGIKDRVITKR